MTWITVTAVPNDAHLDTPRAKMLIDTTDIVAFGARPGEHTQLWTSWNPDEATLALVESLEEIRALIGEAEREAEERRADVLLKRNARPSDPLARHDHQNEVPRSWSEGRG